jgi:hypothetical protein
MPSRTSCLLTRNHLPEGVVYGLSRPEMRPKISVDRDDLPRIALGVMSTAWATPKSLVVDLRHLL